MNRSVLSVMMMILVSASARGQASMGTAFTYQGQLTLDGAIVDGFCNLEFGLWDAVEAGTQLGTQLIPMHPITGGLFTVLLDFGPGVFDGEGRWLEIAIQCPGDATPSVVSPRQELTPGPYALHADAAATAPWDGLTGIPPGFADNVDNDTTYSAGTGLDLTTTEFRISETYQLPQLCSTGYVAKWQDTVWACEPDDNGSGHAHSSLDAADGSPPDALIVDNSGNVGIGTATPTEKLEVGGTVKAIAFQGDGSGLTNLPTGAAVPVGTVFAWLKSYPNTPSLPDGWVECNGQALSAPDSPFDGQTIPDLNGNGGARRFLRGSTTSGAIGGSETHRHALSGHESLEASGVNFYVSSNVTQYESTLPSYYEVVWVMRVK